MEGPTTASLQRTIHQQGLATMNTQAQNVNRFALLAVLFELGLGAVGVALGLLTGPLPWSSLQSLTLAEVAGGLAAGAAAAVAMFAIIVLADRKPVGIFRDLQRTVRRYVTPLFRNAGVVHLLVISLAAGVGEELLFRGYAQAGLAGLLVPPFGPWAALLLASLLFGVCHWISSAYAVVATGMGLLLGGLLMATGSLLAPIVAHALYDFLALLYLTRAARRADAPETTGA
jgi:hypothetical protein